ncbi:MAG TPA: glycosyltransferase family 39 protein [Tepidisphaeraceae bacterium]|jgi:4-amino-4-deoxy-L-arabinose transferase-like glycosyltransferase
MPLDRSFVSVSVIALWLALGGGLLWAASWPPVSRTQEARVLETAREMAERPITQWAIPTLNGAVRLRKPPLAYWMSAASFRVLGVSDFAGRLPMVLLSWATLGMTFVIGRRLFDARTGLFAAAVLAGTWLFFRFGLLAETDGPSAAFLTAGVYTFLRATAARRGRDGVWHHLTAACLAAIILSKGPPAVFLVLFAIGLCAARRQWQPLARFVTSGAVVTLLALATPWFIYVARQTTDEGQLGVDFANSAEGGDHSGPPWAYVPMLLQATLPWTGLWIVGLLAAAGPMRRDIAAWRGKSISAPVPGLWTIALWAAVILVPLVCWGNKQKHYLMPVMPPTAILIGWVAAEASRGREKAARVTSAVMLSVFALSGPAVLIAAAKLRPQMQAADVVLACVLIATAAATAFVWRRSGYASAFGPLAALALGTMFTLNAWLPPIIGGKSRNAALELMAAYPDARFVFRSTELPTVSWTMRREVPSVTEDEIAARSADPSTVVLDQQQEHETLPTVPAGYARVREIDQNGNVLHVYVPEASPWRMTAAD